jgi:hypothetical protein
VQLKSQLTPARVSCLAALAVLILHGSALRDVWTIDPDASAYVGLGQSLAAGDGYALEGIPHGKYTPGLPLLIASIIRATSPDAYLAFHGLLVVMLALTVLITHRLICRLGYPPWAGSVIACAVALSQTLCDLSVRYLRTEVPFMALSLAALLLMSDALGPRRSWGRTALAAAFLAGAISLRMAGITLAVVPVLHLFIPSDGNRSRSRAALLLLTVGLVLGAWSTRGASIRSANPDAPNYSAELLAQEPRDLTKTIRADMPTIDGAGLVRRVGGNLEVLARASAVLLTNIDRAGARLPVGLATLALILGGLVTMVRSSRSSQDAAAYLVATLALYLLWPFNQQERFYVPLLPLLLLAAGLGLVLAYKALAMLAQLPFGRGSALLIATAVAVVLSSQVSDHPTVLGRWSKSYTVVIGASWVLVAGLAWLLRRPQLPELRPQLAWLVPGLFLLPWLHFRAVEWPAQMRQFEERRLASPRVAPLDRIDVDPLLEQVALWLTEHTAPEAVVMTDVPKMLAVLSGRRCIPFRYRIDPPEILHGNADVIFYTRELAQVAAVMDAQALNYELLLELASPYAPPGEEHSPDSPRLYRPRP